MNDPILQYNRTVTSVIERITAERPAIEAAAAVLAETIIADRLIHVIGPGGHSNMAAEEVLWRAGGLAPINAILDAGVNLIHGAKRSNIVERTPGYAKQVLDAYRAGTTPGEVIIIVNAYGVNSMTIDTVLEAKKRGMVTIGITSREFADRLPANHPARHPSGRSLYKEVDHFINCHLPYGDATVQVDGCEQPTGPVSTLCNVYAINLLMIETIRQTAAAGHTPPLWMSANLPGGDEANRANEARYIPRVKHLG